jgi:hypothetical protein
MDLTEGSETSAQLILTPGKYPKESIQDCLKDIECIYSVVTVFREVVSCNMIDIYLYEHFGSTCTSVFKQNKGHPITDNQGPRGGVEV